MLVPRRNILIITDCRDVALTELRQAVRREARSLQSDIPSTEFVTVPNYSVQNAAFVCRLLAEEIDEPSVIFVVLHPYGTAPPERVIGELESRDVCFLGRNSGVFGWMAKDLGLKSLVQFHAPLVQFGGKYTWPRYVLQLCRGQHPDELGSPLTSGKLAGDLPRVGTVVHIDNFGICKVYLSAKDQPDTMGRNRMAVLLANGTEIEVIIATSPYEAAQGELVMYEGSSLGLMEIAVVQGDFASQYNVRVGDQLKVLSQWQS